MRQLGLSSVASLSPPPQRRLFLAVRLWSLKIKCDNVGAGFPRLVALITERGGENPPLRQVMWLRLIFKDHQPTAKIRRRYAVKEDCESPSKLNAQGRNAVNHCGNPTHWRISAKRGSVRRLLNIGSTFR